MNDPKQIQVGGDHYKRHNIQPLDVMQEYMTKEEYVGFLWGNVIKYSLRWKLKNGIEDLKKLNHYVAFLVKYMEKTDGSENTD